MRPDYGRATRNWVLSPCLAPTGFWAALNHSRHVSSDLANWMTRRM